MSAAWDPKEYKDESHEILMKWIDKNIKKRKSVLSPISDKKDLKNKKVNLIDFMSVLKKSIKDKEEQKMVHKPRRVLKK
jgi:non-homologous end joining protein Ku